MDKENNFHTAVDLIYEALLDDQLWPKALASLADVLETAHIGFCTMDRRSQVWSSIAPRTDPAFRAIYRQSWAFANPLWTLSTTRPLKEVFHLDNLIPREQFAASPVYNEWFLPAGFGLAMTGANLHVSEDVSALIAISNAPKQDHTAEQDSIFKAALQHIDRAVRIHHELRLRDLDHNTTPERLEQLGLGVMLVDRTAKVLFANSWARAMLGTGSGLTLHGGRIQSATGSDALQKLIASCTPKFRAANGPGGEISLRQNRRRPLRVTVTPLRARGSVAELPWLGLQIPVAMITMTHTAMGKWPN